MVSIQIELELYQNWSTIVRRYSNTLLVVHLIHHLFSALGFFIFFLNISHLLTMLLTFTLLHLYIFCLRLKYIYQYYLDKKRVKMFPVTSYLHKFTKTVSYFFSVNQMFGRIFTSILLIYCPTNVLMTLWMLEGYIPMKNMFVAAFFITYQVVIIFIFHLKLTKCTEYIHQSISRLFSILLQFSHCHKQKLLLRKRFYFLFTYHGTQHEKSVWIHLRELWFNFHSSFFKGIFWLYLNFFIHLCFYFFSIHLYI